MIEEQSRPEEAEPEAVQAEEAEPPTGPFARLFAWTAVWLAPLLVAGVGAGAWAAYHYLPSIGGAPDATVNSLLPAHPKAFAEERASRRAFGGMPLLTPYAVVQRDPAGLSAAAQAATVRRALLVDRNRGPAQFRNTIAVPVLNTLGLFPGAREHGTTAITYLFYRGETSSGTGTEVAQQYADYLGPRLHVVGATGALPARIAQYKVLEHRLHWMEGATVVLILLIVGLAFRAVLAPLLTVATAAIAFLISQHLLGWVALHASVAMPNELQGVAVALMLGVVTDYSVFFFAGTRERLRLGDSPREAVRRTTVVNAPIVFTAGLVVAVGVLSLLLGTLGFFRGFGPGMAITVATGLLVSLLLVPALLRLFGRAVFWPGLRREAPPEISEWRSRLSRLATTRPVALVVAAATIAALGLAASGLRGFPLGLGLVSGLPSGNPVRLASTEAARGFAPGIVAPTELLLRAPGIAAKQGALSRLQTDLARQPGVAGVLGPADAPSFRRYGVVLSARGDAARYILVLDSDPGQARAIGHLERLRSALPQLLRQDGLAGTSAAWGGETALAVETSQSTHTSLWRVLAVALGLNFLFLCVFLRSLVAPLYLLAASALALAATFGITFYVFIDVLGYDGIPYYVPVAFSVLLLSLGSDYNIFVVGRIWQEAERRPLREAVRVAAPRAGRAITVAGIALSLSFALLAIVPIGPFRVMAFAMCVGILLDTLLVRTLLVPSLIVLVGGRSRWPRRFQPPALSGGAGGDLPPPAPQGRRAERGRAESGAEQEGNRVAGR